MSFKNAETSLIFLTLTVITDSVNTIKFVLQYQLL